MALPPPLPPAPGSMRPFEVDDVIVTDPPPHCSRRLDIASVEFSIDIQTVALPPRLLSKVVPDAAARTENESSKPAVRFEMSADTPALSGAESAMVHGTSISPQLCGGSEP